MTRRTALSVVASLLAQRGTVAQVTTQTCAPVPERQVIDFGSGACSTKHVIVKAGPLTATISVDELMQALGARVGD
jgi:hypothetical protein